MAHSSTTCWPNKVYHISTNTTYSQPWGRSDDSGQQINKGVMSQATCLQISTSIRLLPVKVDDPATPQLRAGLNLPETRRQSLRPGVRARMSSDLRAFVAAEGDKERRIAKTTFTRLATRQYACVSLYRRLIPCLYSVRTHNRGCHRDGKTKTITSSQKATAARRYRSRATLGYAPWCIS